MPREDLPAVSDPHIRRRGRLHRKTTQGKVEEFMVMVVVGGSGDSNDNEGSWGGNGGSGGGKKWDRHAHRCPKGSNRCASPSLMGGSDGSNDYEGSGGGNGGSSGRDNGIGTLTDARRDQREYTSPPLGVRHEAGS